ncbi:tetratricopeptide repeat protein [Novosphingobium bradum]|uniref:Tetratricopeptide repeat protein n=1 Tax=Novosphingobium bradum TaxID=1737444 RepID=A0ABV7IQ04_9SPHN
MLQYILTGLAGLVFGVVAMRVWQARESAPTDALAPPATNAVPAGAAPAPAGNPRRLTARHLLLGAGALAAAGLAVIALRGEDEATGDAGNAALADGLAGPAGQKPLDDVDTAIGRLAKRLEQTPGDGEGWRMLGWSQAMTGHPDRAIEPYKRALALLPRSALVASGYGEALTGVAGGTVSAEARALFEQAIALDPNEPRARYFLALWQAQHGEGKAALDKWIALANSGPADAPWQADVRRQITAVSGKLGIDVSGRLKASAPAAGPPSAALSGASPPPLDPGAVQAASALPEAQRQTMIDGMVGGLAAKLKANPADPERWVLLLRSRMVLKQGEQARQDLAAARRALARDPAGLGKVDAAARDLEVPGA